jgi:hypothetical protein
MINNLTHLDLPHNEQEFIQKLHTLHPFHFVIFFPKKG